MPLFPRLAALLALLLARAAFAADCPPPAQPFTPDLFKQAAAAAKDRGFLWSATKDGRTSYLYGTFHLGRAEWMAPGPAVRQALLETQVLALEIDVLDDSVQRRMTDGAAKVRRVLPAVLQARLQAAWAAECLPPEGLASGPAELQAVALMFASGRRDGINPEYGSEVMLSLIARGAGRAIVSLETPEQQLQALLAADDAEARVFVSDTLDDMANGKMRRFAATSARVWEQGDLDELARYDKWCECMDTPQERQLMQRLLEGRNPGLARGVDELHAQGRGVFAAVGAMHMVGPTGLPALLAARGYQVRRLH